MFWGSCAFWGSCGEDAGWKVACGEDAGWNDPSRDPALGRLRVGGQHRVAVPFRRKVVRPGWEGEGTRPEEGSESEEALELHDGKKNRAGYQMRPRMGDQKIQFGGKEYGMGVWEISCIDKLKEWSSEWKGRGSI